MAWGLLLPLTGVMAAGNASAAADQKVAIIGRAASGDAAAWAELDSGLREGEQRQGWLRALQNWLVDDSLPLPPAISPVFVARLVSGGDQVENLWALLTVFEPPVKKTIDFSSLRQTAAYRKTQRLLQAVPDWLLTYLTGYLFAEYSGNSAVAVVRALADRLREFKKDEFLEKAASELTGRYTARLALDDPFFLDLLVAIGGPEGGRALLDIYLDQHRPNWPSRIRAWNTLCLNTGEFSFDCQELLQRVRKQKQGGWINIERSIAIKYLLWLVAERSVATPRELQEAAEEFAGCEGVEFLRQRLARGEAGPPGQNRAGQQAEAWPVWLRNLPALSGDNLTYAGLKEAVQKAEAVNLSRQQAAQLLGILLDHLRQFHENKNSAPLSEVAWAVISGEASRMPPADFLGKFAAGRYDRLIMKAPVRIAP